MTEEHKELKDRLPVVLDEQVFYELISDDEYFSLNHRIPPEFQSKSIPMEKFGIVFPFGRQKPVVWKRNDLIALLEHERDVYRSSEEYVAVCELFAELRECNGDLQIVNFHYSECNYKNPECDGFTAALNWLRMDSRADNSSSYYFVIVEVFYRRFNLVREFPSILFLIAWLGLSVFLLLSLIRNAKSCINDWNSL